MRYNSPVWIYSGANTIQNELFCLNIFLIFTESTECKVFSKLGSCSRFNSIRAILFSLAILKSSTEKDFSLFYKEHVLKHDDEVTDVTWSPDGKHIATTSNNQKKNSGDILIWNLYGSNIDSTTHEGSFVQTVWSSDGTSIKAYSDSGKVIRYQLQERLQGSFALPEGYKSIGQPISPDGRYVCFRNSETNVISFFIT